MRNVDNIKAVSFAVFTILFFVTVVVSVATTMFKETTHHNYLVNFAIQNYLSIMIIAMAVSIGYGYFWAKFLTSQIKQREGEMQSVLDIVMEFLSPEEQEVLKHLLDKKGETRQAHIAHLSNMGRVKALRTVQKMKDKDLVSVTPHGKQRIVRLNDKVISLLSDS